MKILSKLVVFLTLVTLTIQGIEKKKGCDCTICNAAVNRGGTWLENNAGGGGPRGCSICDKKKELVRMERERKRKLQKCPFDILGSSAVKGKTSEEVFDDFREQIVPSQNGFFDMMRGVVRTMHTSSVAELEWAKEKEAKELAEKKAKEAEERKKKAWKEKESDNPLLRVVLKQTPCDLLGQETAEDVLKRRLAKEADEERAENLQSILVRTDDDQLSGYQGNEDLFWGSAVPDGTWVTGDDWKEEMNREKEELKLTTKEQWQQEPNTNMDEMNMTINNQWQEEMKVAAKDNGEEQTGMTIKEERKEETITMTNDEAKTKMEMTTESPYVKFMTNEEFKEAEKREMDNSGWGLEGEEDVRDVESNLLTSQ